MRIGLGFAEKVGVEFVVDLHGQHHRQHGPEVDCPELGPELLEFAKHRHDVSQRSRCTDVFHGDETVDDLSSTWQVLGVPAVGQASDLAFHGRLERFSSG